MGQAEGEVPQNIRDMTNAVQQQASMCSDIPYSDTRYFGCEVELAKLAMKITKEGGSEWFDFKKHCDSKEGYKMMLSCDNALEDKKWFISFLVLPSAKEKAENEVIMGQAEGEVPQNIRDMTNAVKQQASKCSDIPYSHTRYFGCEVKLAKLAMKITKEGGSEWFDFKTHCYPKQGFKMMLSCDNALEDKKWFISFLVLPSAKEKAENE